MSINSDYAQYLALAEHDAILEDVLNGVKTEVNSEIPNNTLQAIQEEDMSNVNK